MQHVSAQQKDAVAHTLFVKWLASLGVPAQLDLLQASALLWLDRFSQSWDPLVSCAKLAGADVVSGTRLTVCGCLLVLEC